MQKDNPTFRNHDNYNYMIRREYINEEIKALVLSQERFGLFDKILIQMLLLKTYKNY